MLHHLRDISVLDNGPVHWYSFADVRGTASRMSARRSRTYGWGSHSFWSGSFYHSALLRVLGQEVTMCS